MLLLQQYIRMGQYLLIRFEFLFNCGGIVFDGAEWGVGSRGGESVGVFQCRSWNRRCYCRHRRTRDWYCESWSHCSNRLLQYIEMCNAGCNKIQNDAKQRRPSLISRGNCF